MSDKRAAKKNRFHDTLFRRDEKRNNLACRSNTNECPTGEDLNCKKCRFHHFERMLKQTIQCGVNKSIPSHERKPHLIPSILSPRLTTIAFNKQKKIISTTGSCALIEKLKVNYRWMSHTRLIGELNAKSNPLHPNVINMSDMSTFPAIFESTNVSFRILVSSATEFAYSSFPEFKHFTEQEKWKLVVNFIYAFRSFEGTYRAIEIFQTTLIDPSLVTHRSYLPMYIIISSLIDHLKKTSKVHSRHRQNQDARCKGKGARS
ncbi:hypothetical protein PRIPAC_82949 [Pristionchus pacificus]|uniref:NR LBD domain-containing protein n=1 Tax=Pristionchus pacificus TaxID=54126 RepID=A0A2A6BDS2_PRIPA|nr:hypothetical protein PRIPAC_82949 [Pristionchus pacificus]|eukprot:PDM64037.1 hypothetical protein PRIPAC_54281 [Pristionchus pacificus]